MKERRTPGRVGGSESLDQQQERALKRRALLESELSTDEAAELTRLARGPMGSLGLDGYAAWLGTRGKLGPCKVTRVELEMALAERRQEPVMTPRSALAYAAWIVAAERGWHPSKLETNGEVNRASLEETRGSLGLLFGHLGEERPGSGQPLSTDLARRYAPYLGDGGDRATAQARLHTDDSAAEIAAARGAHAVTYGNDIYFGRGELAPGTRAGDELLVHELTHVAQGQRGEIYHMAAKLTSGVGLEAGEGEAELRGKLAAIELHAPTTAAPQVAAPSGQPATPGARAARLAAQKARLAEADRDTIADTESKPPAQAAAEGAVDHPAPEMTAPAVSSGKPNAYAAALEEMPSKQALGAWSQSGGKATAEAKADQAAFEAALPPMPIELSGDDGKPVAKAETAGAQASPKEPPQGAVPAAAVPTTPTPPAPQVTAAAASVENLSATQDPEALKAAGKKALDELPTTSPAVKSDPGTPPVTDLAGQADPVRATAEQQAAFADGAKGLDAEKKKILAGPGAAQIQPAKLSEKLDVPKAAPVEAMPELPKLEGMDKFKRWNLPGDVQSSFDNLAKPKMEANLAQARAKITEAEVKRDGDRDKAVTDAQSKVKAAHVDADAKQQAKVAESRTKITNKQSETLSKQEAEVKKLDKQSGAKKKATLGKINTRIAADQAKVETDYADAQKRADAERQKGEAEAQRQKEEAKKKEEDKSWWDRAVDAVCDAIKAVADAIDKALEAVGKLIGEILDAVKNAACALIDAARDFVCAALSEFGDWLKSAVTNLLGSVFPELAAALNKFIDDAVNAAKAAVNAIADGLKAAVTALCDTLKSTINAAISAYRAAVQAAATFATAVVTGDWKAVAKMVLEGILSLLGIDPAAFYALIGKAEESIAKIIDDPGAFVGHLVDAVKLGFQQFGANFLTHLKDGVVQWLFGTFASAGINIPATFDIAGVFDLTCQVLGLTWPRMRTKVVKVIGEENTERLEFVDKYVEALVSGGFGGLWQQVQADMSGLWDMVIGGARQWLMEKLVQQAIIKVATMWNPAGAIIQLIQTAWNVYCWVRENAQRIFGLVQAVVDSISNIANGNIAGAANYIEASLAKLVPIAISLFANLLGLGGIADKIKDIITKVQTKIDQAIDKLIDRVAKMWKGGGKSAKGDGKSAGASGKTAQADGKKPDENRPIGKRITFKVGPQTHTQYIDKGVPMVASTPTGVKAKVEKEWRPRLQQLEEKQKKQAGSLIGKAISIEKQVAKLAGEAKTDKSKDAPLEKKQQELADTLAVLWEIMAPDLDPSKSFAEQDPKATLKSDQYKQFKQRFLKLATDLQMQGGDAKAQEIWLQVVEALQKTDAAYKAAPTDAKSGRKDLAADGFKKIMGEFEPITKALAPYMEKWTKGKKSWAFWSGKPSVELAKKHAEVCLEKSALGGLFDNINISGGWDIQMWASLSKAYASHAATSIGGVHYSGFVGMGSSADQSIFNKIEQPTFVGMLNEKQKVDLQIDWYAGACNPENPSQPDYRFKAGSIDGVYAKGDRASMVAKAEAENKRRVDLWKDKKINEGPNGSEGEKKDEHKPVGARITFKVGAETHTQYIDDKGTPTVASTPTAVKSKVENEWRPRLQQLPDDAQKKAGALIGKAIGAEKKVAELVGKVKAGTATEAALEAKQRELADKLAQLWEIMAPEIDKSKPFAEQDPKATLTTPQYKQFKERFTKLASELQMQGGDAKAQEIWLKNVEALQKTDAAYKAAPTDAKSGRKDLSADAFQKIMKELEPITLALAPYMEKWAKGKKSWAFWSGKPSLELAKKHGEVCLEKSALGSLFDGINISGSWDIQMWASLSKAYAMHAARNVGDSHYAGFVGTGSSADQSIFNKIEQPTFVGMLTDKQKVTLKIDWYASAGDPEKEMQTPDYRFKAGAIDGVYAKGDRPTMVEQAESENKRRLALWKDKGINEGPGGAAGDTASDAPVIATGDMKGEDHKLTVDLKKGEIRLASIEAGALIKVDDALAKVKGMAAPAPRKKDAEKALTAIRGLIKSLHGMLENYLNSKNKGPRPASIDAMKEKADGIMAALKKYGADFGVHDVVDLPVFDSAEDYKKLAEQVGGERLDKGIAFWESNVKDSQFKEGTALVWAGWQVKDVAAVKAPAIDILAKAAMDDKQPNGKADGTGKMDKLIAGTSPTKVPFFTAAGELATKQAIAEGKAKATKPETKQAIDKTSYVPGGDYGKLETPKNGDHADPRLKRAVQVAGGIVAFMKGMATAKQAGGMTHAEFEAAWADQQNVEYLKDEFRDADPGKHEWIPSNKIKDIITRAHSARDLEQAAAWVELHHTLRCDTEHLIYKPSYAPNTTNIGGVDYTLLCGHSGALHLRNPSGPKPSPSIGMQQTWHTELRDIFEANKTILACIDALRAKFRDTIWDGVTALPADVYTDYIDAAGNPIDWSARSKDQAARFATVDACFEKCRVALAKYN